ncbi:hypothetical protein GH808_14890 [Acetobacterium fimetarium]|uniref:DUF6431 domain-containing protein n=1 Tax=Acetobacterium fimetarium TaxID=52691 RepID=A0ABR6WYS1_9FIRM|nr:DUF6431 domain-containing protein [Acetobacterium fimetarium]MBC3805692.1 hypothetical protein [Acetobacterium fimetarium]
MKTEGGTKQFIQIERLKCNHCERLHNALPDFLVPYKHYAAEIISGVLDNVISADDLDAEDYPCEQTMKRWQRWFNGNQNNIEGNMRSIGYRLLGLGEDLLSARISLLTHLRKSSEVWLETILRIIYNAGSFLVPI